MVATENLSLHEALGSPRLTAGSPALLSIDLPRLINEQDEPMRLLASWLGDEHEGGVFFSGSGGALTVPIPPGALGYRLRRWPSEGLAPEYLDWRFGGLGGGAPDRRGLGNRPGLPWSEAKGSPIQAGGSQP